MIEDIILLSDNATQDSIGNHIGGNSGTTVLGEIKDISQKEFYEAQKSAQFKPEIKVIISIFDYSGEKRAKVKNVIYSIYRTFHSPDRDDIELYLSRS